VVATGFTVIVVFEVCLAAGAPWGSAAFGGADPGRLSDELRIASVVAAAFWSLAALTALARGEVTTSPIGYAFSRRAMWGLTLLLVAGTVMNAASSSPWERYGWAPYILGLTVMTWRLARSPRHDESCPVHRHAPACHDQDLTTSHPPETGTRQTEGELRTYEEQQAWTRWHQQQGLGR
jgi:hypothetical protein